MPENDCFDLNDQQVAKTELHERTCGEKEKLQLYFSIEHNFRVDLKLCNGSVKFLI